MKEWNYMDFWQCQFISPGRTWQGWVSGQDWRKGGVKTSRGLRLTVALGQNPDTFLFGEDIFPLMGNEGVIIPGTLLSVARDAVSLLQEVPQNPPEPQENSRGAEVSCKCALCKKEQKASLNPGEAFSFTAVAERCGMVYVGGVYLCGICAPNVGEKDREVLAIATIQATPLAVRAALGMSQTQFSFLIEMGKGAISDWERGKKKISLRTAKKILSILRERFPEVAKSLGL